MAFKHHIKIKKASILHIFKIWVWRNDKLSRKMSINTNKIRLVDHFQWYFKKLQEKSNIFYIGSYNNKDIGIVRFNKRSNSNNIFDISINLSPLFRGKGFGKDFLNTALLEFNKKMHGKKEIEAQIKRGNISSIKLFKSCGFYKYEEKANINLFRKELS